MFGSLKIVEYLGIAIVGGIMAFMVTRLYYVAQISVLKADYSKQVAEAQTKQAQAEERERKKQQDAEDQARKAQDEYESNQKALQGQLAALSADGSSLRARLAVLAKQPRPAGQDTAPQPVVNDSSGACWSLLATADGLAESSARSAEELAAQVRGLQGYIGSLRPFM